jgi:hypothetical protein
MSIRERLSEAKKRRFSTVHVPILGDVRLRSLTQSEMRALRATVTNDAGDFDKSRAAQLEARVVVACVVDAEGNQEFTEDDVQLGTFADLDGGAWTVLVAACKEHTGFGADADWKAVEGAAKN